MALPIRVVVPADCQAPTTWATALKKALEIGKKAQPPASEYILMTHTKPQLSQTALSSHIGVDNAKALLANKVINITEGCDLRHATLHTLPNSAQQAMVIAYFAEEKMMEKIDSLAGLIGIVVVPESSNTVDTWSKRWTHAVHGEPPTAPVKLISDRVVEKALQGLSGTVNLSIGVMHPLDKDQANETLRILRNKGHALEPDKIKSCAIQNGWKPTAADELAKLAAKIQAFKSKPPIKSFHDADGKYQRWST